MDNIPSPPAVPSIHIQGADDASALFDGGELFSPDVYNLYNFVPEDTSHFPCSQGFPSPYHLYSLPNSSSDLEDIPELAHLTTTTPYLTDHGYSSPYILQENGTTASSLSPSTLGSPIPSPTLSFGSSLSPSSFYGSLAPSDIESPVSPSPATPDHPFFFPSQGLNQSSDSLVPLPFIGSFPNDSILHPGSQTGPHRPRSKSSPSRREPVASKAMLEANGRRRRHPAQFECEDCKQTFTALFSLKRHAQSHTGERPFACGVPGCTQRFYNSSDCKRHEKSRKRHKDIMTQ